MYLKMVVGLFTPFALLASPVENESILQFLSGWRCFLRVVCSGLATVATVLDGHEEVPSGPPVFGSEQIPGIGERNDSNADESNPEKYGLSYPPLKR